MDRYLKIIFEKQEDFQQIPTIYVNQKMFTKKRWSFIKHFGL